MTPFDYSSSSWLALFSHFFMLSAVAVGGGPLSMSPEMHRFLVDQHHWMTNDQFTASIAIAQAAPGPNLLFVAIMGWTIAGFLGMCVTMGGILLPSSLITLMAGRWSEARRETRGVRAFVGGLAPMTVGLVLSTGWLLAVSSRGNWILIGVIVISTVLSSVSNISPLWPIAFGGAVGAVMGSMGMF